MLEVMYEFSGSGTTLVFYLQGEYTSQSWSSEMTTIEAGNCVSISQALVYTTPFLVAIIADSFIGNYLTLLVFSIGAYLPGLIIIALTAYPYLLSETFPTKVLKIAMYVFIPLGSGAIVSCVSVFGAQQFHPTRQISQIESYFIYFYIFSSCGTLIGGMILPVLLQSSAFVGYMLVAGCYLLAVIVFVLGNYHYQYVKMKSQGRNNMQVLSILCNAVCGRGIARQKVSNGGKYSDMVVQTVMKLSDVIPVTMLALPFNIIFSQTLITIPAQGIVMAKSGFVDSLWVQNFNHITVIVIGALLSEKLYPYLEKQEKGLELSSKYVIGAVFGSLAMLWSIIIDVMIVNKYSQDGVAISILWQAPTYMLLGAGEVFTICSAYDAAFNVSPNNLKVLAFGINLFLIGALPKFISQLLGSSCTSFFTTKDGSKDISKLSSYATAHVWKFFLVLLGISLFGVFLNALPPTRRYLKRTINFAQQDNELRQECSCRMIPERLSVKDIQEMYSSRMIAEQLSVRDIPAV